MSDNPFEKITNDSINSLKRGLMTFSPSPFKTRIFVDRINLDDNLPSLQQVKQVNFFILFSVRVLILLYSIAFYQKMTTPTLFIKLKKLKCNDLLSVCNKVLLIVTILSFIPLFFYSSAAGNMIIIVSNIMLIVLLGVVSYMLKTECSNIDKEYEDFFSGSLILSIIFSISLIIQVLAESKRFNIIEAADANIKL